RLQNRGALPVALLGFQDEVGGMYTQGITSGSLDMPSFSQIGLEYETWSDRRGVHQMGPTRLIGVDPVGLFPWETVKATGRTIIVYPRVTEIDLATLAGIIGYANLSQRLEHVDPAEPRGLRPYEPGDDTRFIHW